jgi:hypothetical protein
LCREHGAAKAEIVRHSREAIPPEITQPNLPREFVQMLDATTFTTLSCNFGDRSVK